MPMNIRMITQIERSLQYWDIYDLDASMERCKVDPYEYLERLLSIKSERHNLYLTLRLDYRTGKLKGMPTHWVGTWSKNSIHQLGPFTVEQQSSNRLLLELLRSADWRRLLRLRDLSLYDHLNKQTIKLVQQTTTLQQICDLMSLYRFSTPEIQDYYYRMFFQNVYGIRCRSLNANRYIGPFPTGFSGRIFAWTKEQIITGNSEAPHIVYR